MIDFNNDNWHMSFPYVKEKLKNNLPLFAREEKLISNAITAIGFSMQFYGFHETFNPLFRPKQKKLPTFNKLNSHLEKLGEANRIKQLVKEYWNQFICLKKNESKNQEKQTPPPLTYTEFPLPPPSLKQSFTIKAGTDIYPSKEHIIWNTGPIAIGNERQAKELKTSPITNIQKQNQILKTEPIRINFKARPFRMEEHISKEDTYPQKIQSFQAKTETIKKNARSSFLLQAQEIPLSLDRKIHEISKRISIEKQEDFEQLKRIALSPSIDSVENLIAIANIQGISMDFNSAKELFQVIHEN